MSQKLAYNLILWPLIPKWLPYNNNLAPTNGKLRKKCLFKWMLWVGTTETNIKHVRPVFAEVIGDARLRSPSYTQTQFNRKTFKALVNQSIGGGWGWVKILEVKVWLKDSALSQPHCNSPTVVAGDGRMRMGWMEWKRCFWAPYYGSNGFSVTFINIPAFK